jgi:hypothetical protein
MAPTKWKNKKKKKVVVSASPTKTLTPPSVTVPSISRNIQENPTTNDTDSPRLKKTKKTKKTALAVTFSKKSTTANPPLITGDDLFVASLLSDGLRVSTTNNTPPNIPKKKKPYQ